MVNYKNEFICPECGSTDIKGTYQISSNNNDTIYASVKHEIQCANCFFDIPAHLGKRYYNQTYKESKNEWLNLYKPIHIKDAAKCYDCSLYYWEIEHKLAAKNVDAKNIFVQKISKDGNSDLICTICHPELFN
tara:strand:+ start:1876 stop:2274 length:399 start_codon:yes stop_codon:yes gene_type:complete